MITFPEKIGVPIVNQLTGRRYDLISAADLSPDNATLGRIVEICNEPEVYQWLFQEPLDGRPYPEQMARDWIAWSKAGWDAKTHFVFAVLDEMKRIAAACDIKANGLRSEIGYWSSREHRGVMTNAVVAMCAMAADAGFVGLYARAKKENRRSQAVLERAGFERSHDRPDDQAWFIRTLKAKGPNPAA